MDSSKQGGKAATRFTAAEASRGVDDPGSVKSSGVLTLQEVFEIDIQILSLDQALGSFVFLDRPAASTPSPISLPPTIFIGTFLLVVWQH